MTAAILLLVTGIFGLLVWPPFYRRIAADPRARDSEGRSTRFLRVHTVLIGTALALAVASVVIAILTLLRVL